MMNHQHTVIPFKCSGNGCDRLYCRKCLQNKYNYSKSKISKLLKSTSIFTCPVCIMAQSELVRREREKKNKIST